MDTQKQNPAGGPGFTEKTVSDRDKAFVPDLGDLGNDNSKSAQRFRLLAALRKGPVSTLYARKFYDILHPAARVQELRDRGYLIDTVWVEDITSEGRPHRVAQYLYRGMKGAQ